MLKVALKTKEELFESGWQSFKDVASQYYDPHGLDATRLLKVVRVP